MADDNRSRIIEAAIMVFNEKGAKFTMDDVASKLGMSKKTLYKYFSRKDELVVEAVEHGFKAVKESEAAIINNPDLDILEKIRRVIVVIPDRYIAMDWRRLYEFKTAFPEAYQRIGFNLENGWEDTLALIREGINQGKVRDLPLPIIKCMIENSFEGFLNSTTLVEAGIHYTDALETMIDIVMKGICTDGCR